MSKTTSKKKVLPIFWLTGNYYECQKTWGDIIAKLGGDPNIEVFDCGYVTANGRNGATAKDIISALKHRDMFDDRPRILKMKGIPSDYTNIHDYLNLVDDNNILVIDGPIGYRSKPPSTRLITAASSKFFKFIKANGLVFQFNTKADTDADAIRWVRAVATDLGRGILDEAVSLLVQWKGRELDSLHAELTKMMDYQDSGDITIQSVCDCCIPVFTREVWGFIDDLDHRKYDSAMSYLRDFFDTAGTASGNTLYGDVSQLIGALNHHFEFILLAKSQCGDSLSNKCVKKAVSNIYKRTKGKDGGYCWDKPLYSDAYIGHAIGSGGVRSALRWPYGFIWAIYEDLCVCSNLCRLNSGNTAKLQLILTTFVMLVCNKITRDEASIARTGTPHTPPL